MTLYFAQAMRNVRVRWAVAGGATAVILVASVLAYRTLDIPTYVATGSPGSLDPTIDDKSLNEALDDPAGDTISPNDPEIGVRPRPILTGLPIGPSPIPKPPIVNPKGGFALHVTTDRKAYVQDEQVKITVRACNEGSTNVTYAYWEKKPFLLKALDSAGKYLAEGTGSSNGEYRTRTWEPGHCEEFAGWIWWQTRWSISSERVNGHPRVDPGAYRIEAQWWGRDPSSKTPYTEKGTSDPFELKGVVIKVTTDKPAYTSVERVVATVSACNPSQEAHTQTIVWRPEAEIRIFRDGWTVAQTPNEGPVPKYSSTWAGGECRTYQYSWDQKATVHDPGGGPDGEPTGNRVPPGEYFVEVLWWGHSRSDVGSGEDSIPGVIPDRVPFTLV